MSCYHPLKAFIIGKTPEGKKRLKVTSFTVDYFDDGQKLYEDFIEIPCGHCIGCRLDYSRSWADRLMLELQYHQKSAFVTLTYSPEHIDHLKSSYVDEFGEVHDSYSLSKRDWQLFMKRLRKRYSDKIKFFCCGEYGDTTYRPHFHAILFGFWPEDSSLHTRSSRGDLLYHSDMLDDVWSHGFCLFSEVEWNCCAYVARYVTKKLNGDMAQFYDNFGLEPEFALMSRRPGIAWQWFQDHKDCFDFDSISVGSSKGARKIKIPKYFENFLPELDRELLHDERRKISEHHKNLVLDQTDLDYLSYLDVQESVFQARTNILRQRSKV